MKTTNSNKCTFWNLISNNVIEIPIIQRDYAQGREVEKIAEIRKGFINSLLNALNEDNQLDLDFVYGSLGEDGVFTPLDGQQRLTTLFLLHWYLAVKENKIKDTYQVLKKFTYETRTSSREFCNALVSDFSMFEKLDFSELDSVSSEIKNAPWFFISWEKDPTIRAMLVMLDSIHIKFKDCDECFERLIDENIAPITFQFIELENFGLEDSLYIKMNARGKALTDFENFKAKFEQLLMLKEESSDLPKGFAKEFSNKIDGNWTDLFWRYREKNSNLFDNQVMNFFRAMVINNYASRQTTKTQSNEIENRLSYLIDNKKNISFARYNEYECFSNSVIEEISVTLDCLYNGANKIKTYLPNDSLINEEMLFEKIIGLDNETKPTYTERIQFYALTQYLKKNRANIDDKQLYYWMRVIMNLSENTLYNYVGDFIRSIKEIYEIINHSNDILNFLIDQNNSISGFLQEQIDEERIKATLILKGDKWERAITKAETHGYFNGQIGFILKFSDILDSYNSDKWLNWCEQLNDEYYEKFLKYYEKVSMIFNSRGLNVNNDLWRRALLCKGDYLLRSGRNLSFLIDSHRDVSWKRLLRDNNVKRDYVKELLDDIDIQSINNSLEDIIKKSIICDWREYFIKDPAVLEGCGSGRYIRKDSDDEILLLNSTTMSGYNKEYYTYSLYLELRSISSTNVFYQEDRGAYNYKFVYFNNNDIQIYYEKKDNKWYYEIYNIKDEKAICYMSTQTEVIDYLKKHKFIN